MAVGRCVAINGQKRRFFGMVTDVQLGAANAQISLTPPDVSDPFVAEVIAGTTTFGTVLTPTPHRDTEALTRCAPGEHGLLALGT